MIKILKVRLVGKICCLFLCLSIAISVSGQSLDPEFKCLIKNYPAVKAFDHTESGNLFIAGKIASVGDQYTGAIVGLTAEGALIESFKSPISREHSILDLIATDTYLYAIVDYTLVKIKSSGEIDASFQFAGSPPIYQIEEHDGGILFVSNEGVFKISTEGKIDESFTVLRFNGNRSKIFVQKDGKILVVGWNAISRLNPDGTADITFNKLESSEGAFLDVQSISEQSDGKLLIAGYITSLNGINLKGFARINQNGALDMGFINNLGWLPYIMKPHIALELFNGNIIVGGFSNEGFIVAGLNFDGTSNPNFVRSNLGKVDSNESTFMWQMSDDEIIIVNDHISFNGDLRTGVTKINASGELENTFDPQIGDTPEINDMVVQDDGKMIIVGKFYGINGIRVNNFARVESNGTLDETFVENLDIMPESRLATLAIDNFNRILVGGFFLDGSNDIVKRFNADGTLDNLFNVEIFQPSNITVSVADIFIIDENNMLLGGAFEYGDGKNGLVKVDGNGNIDDSFAGGELFGVVRRIEPFDDEFLIATAFNISKINREGKLNPSFETIEMLALDKRLSHLSVLNDSLILWNGSFENGYSVGQTNPIFIHNRNGALLTDERLLLTTSDNYMVFGYPVTHDLIFLNDTISVLAGKFKRVNGSGSAGAGLAVVGLNGTVYNNFDMDFSGAIKKIDFDTTGDLIIAGSFNQVNGVECSGLVKIKDLSPASPDALIASPKGSSAVKLSWTDVADNESGYIIEKLSVADDIFIEIARLEENKTEYIDFQVENEKIYSYRLKAVNFFDESEYVSVEIATDFVTGLNNSEDKAHIYPNPNNGIFTVPHGVSVESIYDYTGKEKQFLRQASQQGNIINLSESKGIFFVRIKNTDGVIEYSKIIVE